MTTVTYILSIAKYVLTVIYKPQSQIVEIERINKGRAIHYHEQF